MSFSRTFAAGSQHERQGVVVLGSAKDVHDRFGAHARRAGQRMRIAMRHYRNVAFLKLDRFEGAPIDNGDPARAAGNDMIFDRMLRAGRDLVGDLRRGRRFGNPGRSGADVEKHRAGQAHGREHIRQNISTHRYTLSIGRDFFPDTDPQPGTEFAETSRTPEQSLRTIGHERYNSGRLGNKSGGAIIQPEPGCRYICNFSSPEPACGGPGVQQPRKRL